MAPAAAGPDVFGPNDFHLGAGGSLQPGLGEEEEKKIRVARGGFALPEPPAKAELRSQAAALKAVEREQLAKAAALEAREAAIAEKEALLDAKLAELGDLGDAADAQLEKGKKK